MQDGKKATLKLNRETPIRNGTRFQRYPSISTEITLKWAKYEEPQRENAESRTC